VSAICW